MLNGCPLSRESKLKYLGVTFDRCLAFRDHVDALVVKAGRGLNALRVMAATGVDQRMLYRLFQQLIISVIEYGLGLLTVSKSQLERLERIQNAAMRLILGCTRDTPIVCMRHILALPPMTDRHRVLQAKWYLRVAADRDHPLHAAMDMVKGHRLRRGRSWMAQAELSIRQVCDLGSINREREWSEVPEDMMDWHNVLITLGRECREWAAGRTEFEVQELIQSNTHHGDIVIYTDGSVVRNRRSGWGFIAKANGRVLKKESLAYETTTSSMRMEVEAVTAAFHWLEESTATHIVFVTDSKSMLSKVEKGMFREEWLASLQKSQIVRIVWIFCPGHAGVRGNEQADRLAGRAPLGGSLPMDKGEVVARLWDQVEKAEEQIENPHVERMRLRGICRGSGRISKLRGKTRRTFNQTAVGTISSWTLRWLLNEGAEHVWECPECSDVGS